MANNISSNVNYQVGSTDAENLVLIWVDPSVDNDENSNAQTKLTSIHRNFKKFASIEDGKNTIMELPQSSKTILIVSGEYGKTLVPRIHALEKVMAIYVFCMNREKNIEWAQKFDKVEQFHSSLLPLHDIIYTDQSSHH